MACLAYRRQAKSNYAFPELSFEDGFCRNPGDNVVVIEVDLVSVLPKLLDGTIKGSWPSSRSQGFLSFQRAQKTCLG